MPLLAKKVTWFLSVRPLSLPDIISVSSGKSWEKISTLGLAILFDFLRVAGDHRGFAADAYLAFVEILRRASHLNTRSDFLTISGFHSFDLDAGQMHARFDQDGIIDHDLDRVGAGGDDIRAAHGVFGRYRPE